RYARRERHFQRRRPNCERMTSFRQIEANRVRTQEQRSEKTLAKDAVPARRTAESRCRSKRDTGDHQAFEAVIFGRRSNSRRARSGAPASSPLWCMRRAIAVERVYTNPQIE